MSQNTQLKAISGSIYDTAVAATSAKALGSRIPFLGQTVEFDDGRKFVYCSTASNFVAGEMVAVATALAVEFANKLTAAAIGATSVVLNTTGAAIFGGTNAVWAASALAGGYLMITDDAGEGYSYRIKDNTGSTAAAPTTTITLFDPLKVAVTAASDCNLVGAKHRKVVEGAVALSPIGAAVVPTTAATDGVEQFFWVQTKGPAVCLGAATVGVEVASAASGAVANAAEAGSGVYDRIIGTGLGTTSDGYAAVDLRLG